MAGVWERWGDVLVATALAVPLLTLVIALRARAPGRPGLPGQPRQPRRVLHAAAEVLAVAGTVPWVWMILTPLPGEGAVRPYPFQEVPGYLDVPLTEAVVQLGGNLAVFAAFGAFAPVRWRLGLGAVAVVAAAASVTVETLQFALDLGRVSSVDDVLLNTTGAVLAALGTRRWWRSRPGTAGKSGATLCR